MNLALGLFTGIGFGYLLQRGRVLRYDKQVGALLLKDMTIMKFMLSTILVAMVAVYLLAGLGQAKLLFMPAVLGGNILGGLLLGMGWAMVGYCPGTSLGALGEGRWDALFGILGMLVGAALYAEAYPSLRAVANWGYMGSLTLPGATGLSPWLIIPPFVVGVIWLFRWFERKGL